MACTTASGWEFVNLSTSICRADGVTWTISCSCALDTVRALGQILEVRLNTCSTAVGLSVHSYRNDTCVNTVVVCFLNGGCIVRLLCRIAVLWSFIGNRDGNLCCVRIPLVIVLGRRISWDVALCILPRKTCPVGPWAPVLGPSPNILNVKSRK